MTCCCEQSDVVKIVVEIIKVHQLIDGFLNTGHPSRAFGGLHKLENELVSGDTVFLLLFAFKRGISRVSFRRFPRPLVFLFGGMLRDADVARVDRVDKNNAHVDKTLEDVIP